MKKMVKLLFVLMGVFILGGCQSGGQKVDVRESAPPATPTEVVVAETKEETKDTSTKTEEDMLVIGFDASFPPFEWVAENKENQGFNLDVVSAVITKMGRKFELRGLPWAQAMTDLKAGEIQMLSGAVLPKSAKNS